MLLEIFLRELSSHEVVPRLSVYGIAHYYGKYLTLTYGADLYTVSKLLGHANIRSTKIYAKIIDESKRKAVNLIPKL